MVESLEAKQQKLAQEKKIQDEEDQRYKDYIENLEQREYEFKLVREEAEQQKYDIISKTKNRNLQPHEGRKRSPRS